MVFLQQTRKKNKKEEAEFKLTIKYTYVGKKQFVCAAANQTGL